MKSGESPKKGLEILNNLSLDLKEEVFKDFYGNALKK